MAEMGRYAAEERRLRAQLWRLRVDKVPRAEWPEDVRDLRRALDRQNYKRRKKRGATSPKRFAFSVSGDIGSRAKEFCNRRGEAVSAFVERLLLAEMERNP